MKFVKSTAIAFSLVAFVGCSSESKKSDSLVATAGDEKIYASDIDFLKRTSSEYAKSGRERAALETLIESRVVFQEAKRVANGDSAKIRQQLDNLNERFLARIYDEFFIGDNLGHTDSELQKYFDINRPRFADDSCQSLEACRGIVAERLFLEENADSLFRFVSRKVEEMQSVSAEVAYVEAPDSAEASRAKAALLAGSELSGVKRIQLDSKSLTGLWANAGIRELLFGKDSLPAGSVHVSTVDSKNVVWKLLLRRAGEQFPEEGRDSILKARFVAEYRDFMANNTDSLLREKYRFRMEQVRYPEVQKYYSEHADEFNGLPLDSVSGQIEKKLSSGGELSLDSNYVLATLGGEPFIRESDVKALFNEIPPNIRMQYPRARRVLMLAKWKLRAMAAREANLENSPLLGKIRKDVEMSFYRKAFARVLSKNGFFTSDDTLRVAFERFGARIFPNVPLARIRGELGIFVQTPDREFLFEYYRNPERYAKTSDIDSIKVLVFKNALGTFSSDWFERYRRGLYQKYPVTVYDSSYLPRVDLFSVKDLEARADSFYTARELAGAHLTWDRIRALSAEDDSLFARAVYELAKIDGEQEKYDAANGEFAAYYAMWPKSSDAEKALFNRAFLLHENLKRDTLALSLFEEFQEKFPKSDLRESVDWLIRDIRSEGKLSEELLEKISKQEENSN